MPIRKKLPMNIQGDPKKIALVVFNLEGVVEFNIVDRCFIVRRKTILNIYFGEKIYRRDSSA